MTKRGTAPGGLNESAHALLTAAVGCYLFVIAYKIYTGAADGGMSVALAIALAAFFALAGLGVLYYAFRIWQRARAKAKETQTGEDGQSPADDPDMK